MHSKSFMIIAGESSGDMLGAELVRAIKVRPEFACAPFPPAFFGAGGPKLSEAGVELALDLTAHAVFGISDVLAQYRKFRRIFYQLLQLAFEREPDVIILIDFAGFNRRFAKAIKDHVRKRRNGFNNWQPKIVYYVSPQVWASREGRAYQLARDVDLLLSIFPFEKDWYQKRVPKFRVEFVGHPMIDRYADFSRRQGTDPKNAIISESKSVPRLLLLPGSRKRELEAHLPVMIEAVAALKARQSLHVQMVLPNATLASLARQHAAAIPDLELQIGNLADALSQATAAVASSGTVTMECAYFRVPTVVIYKTSWLTYEIAKRIIRVKYIAMPNLLANEVIYPELIQHQATSEAIATVVTGFLSDSDLRRNVQAKLSKVVSMLGASGANHRAAHAISALLAPGSNSHFGF